MFVFLSILVAFSAIATFVAGLLAFLRNPKKLQNRWFLALTISLAFWIPFNFVDSNVVKPFWTEFCLRFDFASALFIAWNLMEFVEVFSEKKAIRRKTSRLVSIFRGGTFLFNIIFAILILSGVVVTSAINNGTLTINYSSNFIVYVVVLLFYFVFAFSRLFYKRLKSSDAERKAIEFVLNGLLIATIANILTNLVFPFLFNSRVVIKDLNVIGYFGFLIFVLFIYLAITTQKLFDIRTFVVRTLVYVVTFSAAAVIYVAPAVVLTTYILHTPLKLGTILYLVATTLVVALLFQPLRNTFNKVTNRLFFRDYYDPQDVLDETGKLLVGTVDLGRITGGVEKIFASTIHPKFVNFALYTDASKEDEETLRILRSSKKSVVVTDELEREESAKLYDSLTHSDTAVAVRLRTTHEELGYIMLGYKQSGSIYTDSDLRLLGVVADEIAVGLQNALRFEEIQNFNLTLQGRVDEATHKLRRANEKLHALDETKDDFISMASHQLRTPLTSVKGYISMILEGDAGSLSKTQKEMLGQAFFSSQRMVYLIADLLNVSRLKTGKFVIEAAPVNLADVVEQEIGQLQETAATRNLTLSYEKPKDFPAVMLDETKTRQVIMNFTDNAIYYTQAGGHIVVKLIDNPQTIELRVVDDGIGVPKSEQPHLFTKFYRAGNARVARPDGTGLGLFMAKKVIAAQGGSLIFESQEGKGSTFGFVFSKTKLAELPKTEKTATQSPTTSKATKKLAPSASK